MKFCERIFRAFITGGMFFLGVQALVVLAGWIIAGYSYIEAATQVPEIVWIVFGCIVGIATGVSVFVGGDDDLSEH